MFLESRSVPCWYSSYQFGEQEFPDVQLNYMVDYIDRFSNVEPTLHPSDEAYLIMLDGFSDMFLDSVSQYFIEYFCI
ncbi:hypothetical protein H671_6g16996 [Cricetulus griseus]|nr:hypothetical protein H671_6g16996 [Cricetulus griseus]